MLFFETGVCDSSADIGLVFNVGIILGQGQYRNAVASGKCDIPRSLRHNVDPTLPRYGTDPVQVTYVSSEKALDLLLRLAC